jgi:HPt (histidine-containing phosphotransfer) domain-containing protein
MVTTFLTDWPHTHATLQQAMTARDAMALVQAAHTLTGALGSLGAQGARAAAQHLEQMGYTSDFTQIIAAYTELEAEMAHLIPRLTTLVHAAIKGACGDSAGTFNPTT